MSRRKPVGLFVKRIFSVCLVAYFLFSYTRRSSASLSKWFLFAAADLLPGRITISCSVCSFSWFLSLHFLLRLLRYKVSRKSWHWYNDKELRMEYSLWRNDSFVIICLLSNDSCFEEKIFMEFFCKYNCDTRLRSLGIWHRHINMDCFNVFEWWREKSHSIPHSDCDASSQDFKMLTLHCDTLIDLSSSKHIWIIWIHFSTTSKCFLYNARVMPPLCPPFRPACKSWQSDDMIWAHMSMNVCSLFLCSSWNRISTDTLWYWLTIEWQEDMIISKQETTNSRIWRINISTSSLFRRECIEKS